MKCTCEQASREARNAALEDVAQWHEARADLLKTVHEPDDQAGRAAVISHRLSAITIRAMKAGRP
jgi:hypothetical protein